MTASGGFGRWGWSGQCAPGSGSMAGTRRFSVGVWPRDEDGKKTGPVVMRVWGYSAHANDVYRTAERCCRDLDDLRCAPDFVAEWFNQNAPLGVTVRLTKAGRAS